MGAWSRAGQELHRAKCYLLLSSEPGGKRGGAVLIPSCWLVVGSNRWAPQKLHGVIHFHFSLCVFPFPDKAILKIP